MMKFHKAVVARLLGLSLLCAMLFIGQVPIATAQSQEAFVARAVVIYQSSCGSACAVLFETTLPQLQNKYGDRLELVLIDADIATNGPVTKRLLEEFQVPDSAAFPLFLIGQSTLSGLPEILQQADVMVELSLKAGGGVSPLAVPSQMEYERLFAANNKLNQDKESLSQKNENLSRAIEEFESSLSSAQRLSLSLAFISVVLFVALIAAIFAGLRMRQRKRDKPSKTGRTGPSRLETQDDEAKFIRTLVGQGKYATDFLTLMAQVSEQYMREKKVSPRAARLARDFLIMAEDYLGLQPIEKLWTQVLYDPTRHIAYSPMRPDTPAWVIEPGWQQHGRMLKKAGVQARRKER